MVPNTAEILPKISTAWVGRTSVTDRQMTERQHTDGSGAYSEREHTFTFAKSDSVRSYKSKSTNFTGSAEDHAFAGKSCKLPERLALASYIISAQYCSPTSARMMILTVNLLGHKQPLTSRTRVVRGSVCFDPAQSNPPADWPNPTHHRRKIWTHDQPKPQPNTTNDEVSGTITITFSTEQCVTLPNYWRVKAYNYGCVDRVFYYSSTQRVA